MGHDATTAAARAAATDDASVPLADSRRLTGPNPYFDATGAVLETDVGASVDRALLDAWRANVEHALRALAWPQQAIVQRPHASGATLAFAAPFDQLYAATEVNEWAWLEALRAHGHSIGAGIGLAPGHAIAGDIERAMHSLKALARAEAQPGLVALDTAAHARGVPMLLDNDELSLGEGDGSLTWSRAVVPAPDAVPWDALHDIPTALVTGTNGKTTTVRLLAAMLRAHGLHTAHSCTDGLYLDGDLLEGGDYSGPGGARALLRNRAAQAAVLETARGGMLRHGLAVHHADVAVVTNVSSDHLGDYGIDDLDALAHVKLTVARALDTRGVLVLNADDARLVRFGMQLDVPHAWFALDDAHHVLVAQREAGAMTCAVSDAHLWLCDADGRHDLGAIDAMPLSLHGTATYNLGNLAAASLAARALGVPVATIAMVLASFGRRRNDNPGRLQHWHFGGIHAFVDFAHNPEGMRGLLESARRQCDGGRLLLALGMAGDRSDADLRALATAAAAARPDRVIVKEVAKYLRGRNLGEVPRILTAQLEHDGVATSSITQADDEISAARTALAWARAGDVLVLQALATAARNAIGDLLDELQASGWTAGEPLPAPPPEAQGLPA